MLTTLVTGGGEVADVRAREPGARAAPRCVVMDIKMPDMDGIEAAKVLTKSVSHHRAAQRYGQARVGGFGRAEAVSSILGQALSRGKLAPAIDVALRASANFRRFRSRSMISRRRLRRVATGGSGQGILMDKQGLSEAEEFRQDPEDEHGQSQADEGCPQRRSSLRIRWGI